MRAAIREGWSGVRLVGTGFATWRSSPRAMLLGLIPGALTALLFLGAFVAIGIWADDWARDLATAATGDETPNGLLVGVIVIAIIGGGVLLAVYTFAAVTLLIGQPFFEAICDIVAERAGVVPSEDRLPWWRSAVRDIGDGIRLLICGIAIGLATFVLGLIPGIGAAAAFVFSAIAGGYLLSIELTAYPFARAGLASLKQRRRALAARRSRTVGFGVAAYVLCLIPLGAVISMPSLVAGGTLLAAEAAQRGEAELTE